MLFGFASSRNARSRLEKLSEKKDTFLQALQFHNSVLLLVDADEKTWKEASDAAESYFHKKHINGKILFLDQRGNRDVPLPVLSSRVISEDCFRKNGEPVRQVADGRFDLFISLATGSSYPLEYMISHAEAKVRVGRDVPQHTSYDVVVSAPEGMKETQAQAFDHILSYLGKFPCK